MVKSGYKQTEVGVVPEDWEVSRIDGVCRLINGRGFKPHEWRNSGHPIIRIQNLNGSTDFNYYQGAYNPKIEVQDGQLLFAWSGSRGTSFGPHVWRGEMGLLNYHTWKVETYSAKIEPQFFFVALKELTRTIEEKAHGASALVHTQKWEMEGYKFSHPASREEQKRIAEALSDVDALIARLEALIAKKRDLKTGTMQQLLTGKTRLPGFGEGAGTKETELGEIPEDWLVAAVGDLAEVKTGPFGSSLHESDYVSDGTPIITVEHLGEFGITQQNLPLVGEEDTHRLSSYRLRSGDIAFSRVGSVDRNALVTEDEDGWLFSGRLLRVRVLPSEVDPFYLSFHFKTEGFRGRVLEVAVGQTMASLNTQILKSVKCVLPTCPKEQAAIGEVLHDIDQSIVETIGQVNKAKALKQGMMQELLTGRTRLI